MNIIKVILSIVIPLLGMLSSHAQYYSSGQDPFSVKWKQIKTDHFQVIYPKSFEEKAQYLANIMELDDNQAAVSILEEILEPDNIVLIKGSNSQRMNEIVTALSSSRGLTGTQKDLRNKK